MRKLLNNPLIAALLAAMAMTAAARAFIGQRDDPGEAAFAPSDDGSRVASAASAGKPSVAAMAAAAVAASAPVSVKDPFAGFEAEHAAAALPIAVKLTALWAQGGDAYAVLNGRIVRQGEALEDRGQTIRFVGPDAGGNGAVLQCGERRSVARVGETWGGR